MVPSGYDLPGLGLAVIVDFRQKWWSWRDDNPTVTIARVPRSMREYQYFAFRAVDGPVSSANLKYMRRQSTRAEITPWSFDNEYHFGDFSGNTLEMLQRGYDIHLHFAIYGTLKLMFYLPRGLPDQKQAKPYLEQGALDYAANKKKGGGILTIDPYYEPFDDRWDDDWDTMLNSLAPLRDELMGGICDHFILPVSRFAPTTTMTRRKNWRARCRRDSTSSLRRSGVWRIATISTRIC